MVIMFSLFTVLRMKKKYHSKVFSSTVQVTKEKTTVSNDW